MQRKNILIIAALSDMFDIGCFDVMVRFPPVGRIRPVSHMYAPSNRGSVRLKARRRDWWLSCV
jgi:hypothetical protein